MAEARVEPSYRAFRYRSFPCWPCGGTGDAPSESHDRVCPVCAGAGRIELRPPRRIKRHNDYRIAPLIGPVSPEGGPEND